MIALMVGFFACAPTDSTPATDIGRPETAAPEPGSRIDPTAPHAVTPTGEAIHLEIARTPEERARGLMFRASLPQNHGMLFLFERSDRHGFWMKNTFIPLDMLWLREDGTIAAILKNVPPCSSDPCPSYVPDAPGSYVLELAAGEAERLGLSAGDQLQLRNIEAMSGG